MKVALDWTVRLAGLLVAVGGAAVTAVLEVFLTPLRVEGVLVGVSVLLAIVGNVALAWFARAVTGSLWAIAPTAIAWFAIMVVAAGRTREGDILLAGNNWVGLATIFAGTAAAGVTWYRMVLPKR